MQTESRESGFRYDIRPYSSRSSRSRTTLRRVDPWSVLKFSIAFNLALLVVGVIAAMALFYVASSLGIVENISKFVSGIGWPQFEVTPFAVFKVVLLAAIVQVIIWTGATLIMTFLYNLVADVFGGVEVTITDQKG